MYEYAGGGLPLAAVARHGVTVIEVTAFAGVEGGGSTGVPTNLHTPAPVDLLDRTKLAVRHATIAIRCGHLHAIACGEGALTFAIKRDALETSRVVAECAVIIGPSCHLIRLRIDPFHPCVVAGLDAEPFAAAAVSHDVAFFIPFRPLAIGAGNLLARHPYRCPMLVPVDLPLALHRSVNHVVQILARPVVRRDDERRLGVLHVFVRDCAQAILTRADFMNTALLGNMFDNHGPTLWMAGLIHDADKSPDEIVKAIDAEIARLQTTPVTKDELELALVTQRSALYGEYESFVGFGKANLLASFALFDDDPSQINRLEERFRQVTPELIRRRPSTCARRTARS